MDGRFAGFVVKVPGNDEFFLLWQKPVVVADRQKTDL
jgi:hypothetical protein